MPGILGMKLRKAREEMGLSQGELARAVGLSSEFISLLEIGKRMPSLASLKTLSNYLKKDMSYFLKEEEEGFKRLFLREEFDKKTKKELKKFQKYCMDYLNLEGLTGLHLEPAPHYTNVSAERLAMEERRRIGLGNEPIRDIFSLLELNGLHILRQPISDESKISGVFLFLKAEEASFALINRSLPYNMQVLAAAHQYCHFLKDRFSEPIVDNLDVLVDEFLPLYHPREKYAHLFACRFLMPPAKIKEIIEKDIRQNNLSLKEVFYLRRYFGVGTQAMLNTLKEFEYIQPVKFKEYQKIDYDSQEKALFGNLGQGEEHKKSKRGVAVSDRFVWIALEAYRKKKIDRKRLESLLKNQKISLSQ